MHEEGFEPSHHLIVGLKSTALDHSAIHALFFSPTRHAQEEVRTLDPWLIRPVLCPLSYACIFYCLLFTSYTICALLTPHILYMHIVFIFILSYYYFVRIMNHKIDLAVSTHW